MISKYSENPQQNLYAPCLCRMQRDCNMIPTINLAYYKEKDWKRFLELIDDRDSIHDTWKEWHKEYLKTKNELISQGFIV